MWYILVFHFVVGITLAGFTIPNVEKKESQEIALATGALMVLAWEILMILFILPDAIARIIKSFKNR